MAKKKFKVLLVDDEKEYVESLSERLELRDLDAEIAYDGEQALEALGKGQPDVMVLDLRMPGIDGMEVLRRVSKTHPDMRVIILTGHGADKDMQEAKQIGAFEYMQKPVNIDKLDSTLNRAWRSLKAFKQQMDQAWMATAFSHAGENGHAADLMNELNRSKKDDSR